MSAEEFERNRREAKRLEYKPERIKWLLIAEAPPDSLERFFYYEDVRTKDILFYETMDLLYGAERDDLFRKGVRNIKKLRHEKKAFLERFRDDGFYLIDALDMPLSKEQKRVRKQLVMDNRKELVRKVHSLVSDETKIILITPSVYRLQKFLEKEGIRVINETVVNFPLIKGREKFRSALTKLLTDYFDIKRKAAN